MKPGARELMRLSREPAGLVSRITTKKPLHVAEFEHEPSAFGQEVRAFGGIPVPNHTVSQGECITSIACKYGFTPQTIYNHANNSGLKRERPNPNILFPGDQLFIPDVRVEKTSGATGQVHRFVLKQGLVKRLRLAIEDADGERQSNCPFELKIGPRVERGKTTANGMIEKDIPVELKEATLTLEIEQTKYVWNLQIGFLNPAENAPDQGVSGIQASRTRRPGRPH